MYSVQKEVNLEQKQKQNERNLDDINLDKALEAISKQAKIYKSAGMTHISSLLV